MNASSIGGEWAGRVIDGRFPLLRRLGSSRRSSLFLTEFGDAKQKATIKLIAADSEGAEIRLALWEAAQRLSHANLTKVFASGRCEIDSKALVYVVSEFADQVLAEVLGERALTPQEAREMLGPTLDALSYLHEKGFVHNRLKPSNIMAIGDRLMLSGDGIVSAGAAGNPSPEPTVFDAPESIQGPIGTAADVWSLGATLVEVFALRPPAWDGTPAQKPTVPESVPQPFATIARECLRIDPARRCTLEQIHSRLTPPSNHPAVPEPADGKTIARRRLGVVMGAGAVLLATIAIWMAYELHHEPSSSPPTEAQSAVPASPAAEPAPASAPPAASAPAPSEEASSSPNPRASTPPPPASQPAAAPHASPSAAPATLPSPAPAEPSTPVVRQSEATPAAAHLSGVATATGEVSHPVQPDVSASAMKTISGTLKVVVRVSVDAAGNVTNAEFDSAGPSKYFASKALEAARHFAFRPAQDGGQPVASTWILHFDFRREGISITSAETTP